ncbi:MAG: NAD(P)-dependent oxidoreductase [Phycisphaerae bacterium]|nr:NAD(P)-dependent oxidoreductase [Phycisphaerae bacterium]
MNILVTGGAGFIGSYFVPLLQRGGHHVSILDLVRPDFDSGSARIVVGDVRDARAVETAMAGCTRVLHLAAAHHDFGISEKTYYDVNERASRILCDALDAAGVADACFYSSVAVFGDAPKPHDEGQTPAPTSPYGGSKLAGERVFREWTERGGGRRCLVIRPTITFGVNNFANMYSLIRQLANRPFVPVGDGSNVKSLSYVENIVDATMFLWDKPGRPAFDVYNYVEKPDLTSRQICETILRALGKKPVSWHVPLWAACLAALPFDLVIGLTGKNLPISSARIRKLFSTVTLFEAEKVRRAGFVPRVPLREGIEKMVRWYQAEGCHKTPFWRTPPERVGGPVGRASMASAE